MRRGLLLTCAFALAVPAATAAPPKPAFHVTIHATLDGAYDYATQSDCTTHETRHVVVRNAKPLTLTAYQLGDAKNFFFDLTATETRSVTAVPSGCTSATSASSACGTVTYTIPSIGTGVGFTNRTSTKFNFFYTRIGSDPYAGKCGPGVEPTPGSKVPSWIDNFPPGGLPRTHPTVDRAKLTAHKRFVVQWSEDGESQAGTYHQQVAISWQVTLVPVT
jgi:hypothetical protein